MRTIALLHPLPTLEQLRTLQASLGGAWVHAVEWIDCEAVPRVSRLCVTIERIRPDVVLAFGLPAARILPSLRHICFHPFKLYCGLHPGCRPVHDMNRVLRRIRVELDMHFNSIGGSGACK